MLLKNQNYLIMKAIGTILIVGTAGCAAGPNPTIERLRAAYDQARQDPDVSTHASVALREAGTTLNRAEQVWQEDRDSEEIEHLAYLAEQKIAIARARAEQKLAETEIEKLGGNREQILLGAAEQRAKQLEQKLAEFKARETERGLLLTLGDVLFEVGRADLKPGMQRKLIPLATFLQENPDRNILVEGHTDSTGSAAYNLELSRWRADAVATFLINQGINPARITTRGYGQTYPVAPNTTAAGRQQNRRVEIILLKEGEVASDNIRS
jgi:OOP family OmpA-OmpF porin